MKLDYYVWRIFLLSFAVISCSKEKDEKKITVITATGDLTAEINEFRKINGATLNTTTGQVSGRREINWDAVPDNLPGNTIPSDFFNPVSDGAPVVRQRGLFYSSTGGEFRVSSSGFADVNPLAAGQFAAFSGNKTFANTGSSAWEVSFQVPGQLTEAAVKGFGAVFSDVDLDNSTSLEFFNGATSLGKYFVPAHNATSSFSFLGVYFNNGEQITRIQVSHQGDLSAKENDITNGGKKDLIVLDDFIYSEPVAR